MVFISGLVVCYGGGGFGSSDGVSAQSSPGFHLNGLVSPESSGCVYAECMCCTLLVNLMNT
jgi:hypothetical protein